MNQFHSPADVLRKIGLLALLGFGAIMLSGPILAILSVAISVGLVVAGFALVGFLVWLPLRILSVGSRAALGNARELAVGVGRVGASAGRGLWRVAALPLRAAQEVFSWAIYLVAGTLKLTWVTTWALVEISLVALTGAVVGVSMGLWNGSPGHDLGSALLSNGLVGGLIGLVTGAVLMVRERRASRPSHAV